MSHGGGGGGRGGGGRVKYSGLTVKKAIEECFNDFIIAAVVATGYAAQILMICIIQAFIYVLLSMIEIRGEAGTYL